jgi:D-alanine-D-alanine ligase
MHTDLPSAITGSSAAKVFVYNVCMRIAVLRGGPSKHYETSLKTGEFVLSHLRSEPEKYRPVDVFIDKDGSWHVMGRKQDPHRVLRQTDLVWNALHGEYGEDGELSRLLANMRVPHTGSSTLGLAMSINKDLSKKAFETHGLLTPRHEVLPGDVSIDDLLAIFRSYLHPVIIKPVKGRASIGTKVAHSFEELKAAVADAFAHAERVMVEEFIRGTVASCGIIDNFRGEKHYALIPLPNSFKPEVHKGIEYMAKKAHEALGLRHYSLSDFIVTPRGKIYILETNALPDLTPEASLSQSLPSVGLNHKAFIEHVISIAR